MSTSRPFAYNPGTPIEGTIQVGNLAIGYPTSGFSGSMEWWQGPDEELGYVIAKQITGDTQPTPIPGVTASVAFNRSLLLTEASFIEIANKLTGQTFLTGNQASLWLTANGYWNSWNVPVSFSLIGTFSQNLVTNKTFTGIDIVQGGMVYVGITWESNNNADLSSVSIGGQSASIDVTRKQTGGASIIASAFASKEITGSTTIDITVNFSAGVTVVGISVWRVDNYELTSPQSVGSDSSAIGDTLMAIDFTPPINSLTLIQASNITTAGFTWGEATEVFDESLYSTTQQAGAYYVSPLGQNVVILALSNDAAKALTYVTLL